MADSTTPIPTNPSAVPTPWNLVPALPSYNLVHSQQQQHPHQLPTAFELHYHHPLHPPTEESSVAEAAPQPAQIVCTPTTDIGSLLLNASTNFNDASDAPSPHQSVADLLAVTCPVCNITLKNQKNLRSHMNTHNGTKNFHCTLCPKSFLRSNQLKSHHKVHTGERPFECGICLKTFSQSSNYLVHKSTHFEMPVDRALPFQCTICQRSFAQQLYLKAHMRVHTDRDPMRCRLCRRKYDRPEDLEQHQREHIDVNRFRCLECDKEFERYINLKNHRFTHNGLKPHPCTVCGKPFAHTTSLAVHMRTHTGEKPYACTHCDSTFSQWANYHRHLGTHTREPIRHECGVCGKSFDKSSSLKCHERTHEPGRASWDCEVCGRVFMKRETYELHRETHREQCAECGVKVGGPRAYVVHMQRVHGQYLERARHLRCDICEQRFQNVRQIRRHMRETHTGEEVEQQQLFKCDDCDVWANEMTLECHVRERHQAYIRHGCPHCRLDFAHTDFLLKHLQEHLGQKQCEQCGKIFKNFGLYKRHQCVRAEYMREMQEREAEKCRRLKMKEELRDVMDETAVNVGVVASVENIINNEDEKNEPAVNCPPADAGDKRVKEEDSDSDISYEFLLNEPEELDETTHANDVPELLHSIAANIKQECKTQTTDHIKAEESDTVDGRDDDDFGNHETNDTNDANDTSSDESTILPTIKPEKFTCTDCPRYFNTAKRLRRHHNSTHLERTFQCDQCAHTFLRRSELISHLRSHSGERPFQCEICSKCFTQSSALSTHKRVHTGERPFACSVCPKRFKQTSARKRHEALHTGDKPFTCMRCSRAFASADGLQVHQRVHDRVPGEKKPPRARAVRPPPPIRVQQPQKSGEAEGDGAVLGPNGYYGDLPHACEVCRKTFAKACTLYVHSKIHTGEKNHQCDSCPKAFAQAANLKRHQLSHNGRRPFHCFQCTKWFAKQETLDAHMELHREQERAGAVQVLQVCSVQPEVTAIVVNGGEGLASGSS